MSSNTVLTYAVPRRPRSRGAGPFGLTGMLLMMVDAITGVLLMTFVSKPLGLAVGLGGALLLLAAVIPDRHHKSLLERVSARVAHADRKRRGLDEHRPGMLTQLGENHLPGTSARSKLTEGPDARGESFALLSYPQTGHHVVGIEMNPPGAALVEQSTTNQAVRNFDSWLTSLAHEPELVQAAITVEIAPDAGAAMHREIDSQMVDGCPELSRLLLTTIKQEYPQGGSTARTMMGLTFATPGGVSKAEFKKDAGAAVTRRRLTSRLPLILKALPPTGAGQVRAMNADDFIETVSCAFRPGMRELYQQLRSRGEARPVKKWGTAGPNGANEEWDHYLHGDGVSVVWETTGFTSSEITSEAMASLLQASEDIDVLRVTWLYRPVNPAMSGLLAEANHSNAEHRVGQSKKPSARAKRELKDAKRTRKAEAQGSALINFAVVITATVRGAARLSNAKAAVDHLAPAARMLVDEMNGSMAAGFAQGIGILGLVTDAHLTIPTSVSKGL